MGQKVGMVKFSIDGKPVAKQPLVALETVDHANFFSRALDDLHLLFK